MSKPILEVIRLNKDFQVKSKKALFAKPTPCRC